MPIKVSQDTFTTERLNKPALSLLDAVVAVVNTAIEEGDAGESKTSVINCRANGIPMAKWWDVIAEAVCMASTEKTVADDVIVSGWADYACQVVHNAEETINNSENRMKYSMFREGCLKKFV